MGLQNTIHVATIEITPHGFVEVSPRPRITIFPVHNFRCPKDCRKVPRYRKSWLTADRVGGHTAANRAGHPSAPWPLAAGGIQDIEVAPISPKNTTPPAVGVMLLRIGEFDFSRHFQAPVRRHKPIQSSVRPSRGRVCECYAILRKEFARSLLDAVAI